MTSDAAPMNRTVATSINDMRPGALSVSHRAEPPSLSGRVRVGDVATRLHGQPPWPATPSCPDHA